MNSSQKNVSNAHLEAVFFVPTWPDVFFSMMLYDKILLYICIFRCMYA